MYPKMQNHRRKKKISQPGQIFLGRDPDIVDTDQVLVQPKVREETVQNHFDRMNQKQQEEMKRYKRTLMEPANKSDV